jgi:hypothetical protein
MCKVLKNKIFQNPKLTQNKIKKKPHLATAATKLDFSTK